MVYITKNGVRLPDKIRFDPDVVRSTAPDKLVARGLFATRAEALRAVELLIAFAKEETERLEAGTLQKSG